LRASRSQKRQYARFPEPKTIDACKQGERRDRVDPPQWFAMNRRRDRFAVLRTYRLRVCEKFELA
jgi:hypothetical protein